MTKNIIFESCVKQKMNFEHKVFNKVLAQFNKSKTEETILKKMCAELVRREVVINGRYTMARANRVITNEDFYGELKIQAKERGLIPVSYPKILYFKSELPKKNFYLKLKEFLYGTLDVSNDPIYLEHSSDMECLNYLEKNAVVKKAEAFLKSLSEKGQKKLSGAFYPIVCRKFLRGKPEIKRYSDFIFENAQACMIFEEIEFSKIIYQIDSDDHRRQHKQNKQVSDNISIPTNIAFA